MRQKNIFLISLITFFLLTVLFIQKDLLLAQEAVSAVELIRNAKDYDGKVVIFRGEVVADVMRRGDFSWVVLHDGDSALGVWVSSSLAKNIVYTGGYKRKGDVFEVKGIFNRACSQHGGDLDIHALEFKKIYSGYQLKEEDFSFKKKIALGLLGGLLLVWILRLLLRKHKKK